MHRAEGALLRFAAGKAIMPGGFIKMPADRVNALTQGRIVGIDLLAGEHQPEQRRIVARKSKIGAFDGRQFGRPFASTSPRACRMP